MTQCPRDTFLGFRKESNVGNVGQLAIKEEAAGKVRVFALVDIWTQSVLYPIHQSIAAFLKSLPNDATFNQGEAVKRCFSKIEKSGRAWCFDLSAATDRLPVSIQIKILSCFLGDQIATA